MENPNLPIVLIVLCLIILGLLIIIFLLITIGQKPTSSSTPSQIPQPTEESPQVEEPKPETLFIYCSACGTEISRHAPACPKCGHPVYQVPKPNNPTSANSSQTIVVQQSTPQSNSIGTAGFILALISLCLSWVPGVGWFVWFLGFLLSFIGMFKSPRGLAITGFLISIIDLIILVVLVGSIAGLVTAFLP